jgi:plastocyanin
MDQTRRNYLKLVSGSATAGTVALAGCSGGESTDTEGASDTEAPTDTEMGTETETAAPTGTDVSCEESNETYTVEMGGSGHGPFFFDPVGLYVKPGDTVEFVNDTGGHSATSYAEELDSSDVTRIPEDAEAFNSGTLNDVGASWQYTFTVEGTYDYFCIPHKGLGMIGRIVVCQPGGPATEGSPPDGELPDSQRIVEEGSISWDDWDS